MNPTTSLCAHVLRRARRDEKGCLVWLGATKNKGRHGNVRSKGKNYAPQRIVWEKRRGPVPKGMFLISRCGNTLCIDDAHRFVGTREEKLAMQREHDAFSRGEKHARALLAGKRAKLDWRKVRGIRRGVDTGHWTADEAAKLYNVDPSLIRGIVADRYWRPQLDPQHIDWSAP